MTFVTRSGPLLGAAINVSSPAGLRMTTVEPVFFLKSAKTRVTVSREVPIICAISSWLSFNMSRPGCRVSPALRREIC